MHNNDCIICTGFDSDNGDADIVYDEEVWNDGVNQGNIEG